MNICVLLLDCLRADHLGCYGYGKPTSPNIDAIAGRSLVFENAISQSNWTYPSLYSMFTGRYPSSLKISWWTERVNDNVPVLTDMLAKKGYRTCLTTPFKGLLNPGCFSSHFQEKREFKMKDDQPGFLARWAKENDKSFLFMHMGEFIHEPFFADSSLVSMFLEPDIDVEKALKSDAVHALTSRSVANKNMRKVMTQINTKLRRLSDNENRYMLAAYDAGIRHVDEYVGRMHKALADSGKDYLFIVTADHGQAFMEHGVFGHGLTVYSELTHVPLIMDMGGRMKGRIKDHVQLMDLFPTFLDMLGLEYEGLVIDSDSLWPVMNGGVLRNRPVVSEGYPFITMIKDGYKLMTKYSKLDNFDEIHNPVANSWKKKLLTKAVHYMPDKLFALSDAKEENNLAGAKKEVYASMLSELNTVAKRFTLESRPAVEVGIDDEIKKQLENLGYI